MFGPALIEHVLLESGFASNAKLGKDVDIENDLDRIVDALHNAEKIMENASSHPSEVKIFIFVLILYF